MRLGATSLLFLSIILFSLTACGQGDAEPDLVPVTEEPAQDADAAPREQRDEAPAQMTPAIESPAGEPETEATTPDQTRPTETEPPAAATSLPATRSIASAEQAAPAILPAPLYFLSNGQIQRLETDGTTLTQLTQESEPITDFDVSPIDARLVYVTANDLIEANPQYGTRFVKVDGEPVADDDPEALFTLAIGAPRFSPDGRQITFGMAGVNVIPVGDAAGFQTLIASDPYPDPNNPPRSTVRFFTAGEWSPDGRRLLVEFAYWPEGSGIAIFDLETGTLTELSTDDPNTPICCDWAWSRDSATGYIASNLLTYGIPGLSIADVTTGEVTELIRGQPPGQVSQDDPLRLFRSPTEAAEGALLVFLSTQTVMDEPSAQGTGYAPIQVNVESGEISAIREDRYQTHGEIRWARDGSGAVIVQTDTEPHTGIGEFVWLPVDPATEPQDPQPPVRLPGVGKELRWGPSATAPLAESSGTQVEESDGQDITSQSLLTATVALNLRSGPSTAYPIVGELAEGDSVRVSGISPDGEWWQVAYVQEDEEALAMQAWVIGEEDFSTVTNVEDVSVVTPPPLPRAVGRIYYSAPNAGGAVSIFAQSLAPGAAPELILENASQPSLLRDSQQLAVLSSQSNLLGLGILDLESGTLSGVTSHPEDNVPNWSPDGSRLVFASTRHGDRRWRVYTTPVDASETATEVAFGNDPDWHPSADLIVYKGCDDQGEQCGLWTMDSSGANRVPLTEDRTDSRPIWSANGRLIVFMSESRHGNWEVYSIDADGNVLTRLTDSPSLDGLPTISPDGTRVAFVSNRGDSWGIWVMPIAGGTPQKVIDIGTDLPSWLEQGIDWAE